MMLIMRVHPVDTFVSVYLSGSCAHVTSRKFKIRGASIESSNRDDFYARLAIGRCSIRRTLFQIFIVENDDFSENLFHLTIH